MNESGDALLAGATGLIGRELAAQWRGPGLLHLLVRRAGVPAGALQRVQVVDFNALGSLPRATMAFCCLGTTIKVAGSKAAFRAVDFDAVLKFAQAAKGAGVTRLGIVSALGANPRSANFYSRTKGEMEAALKGLGLASLVIARPSLLAGNRAALAQAPRPGERLTLAITAPVSRWLPLAWRPIEAATVARALIRAVADTKPGVQVLESAQLQKLGR